MSDATPIGRLAGGCHCGAVRYRIDGPVLAAGVCHCATCRRCAGAESVGWLTVEPTDLTLLAGDPVRYTSSPGVTRTFCPTCGTSLTYQCDPGSIDLTLASLDDPEAVPPTRECWLDDRLSWNPANPALEGFPGGGD
jgi:hypothetical protein